MSWGEAWRGVLTDDASPEMLRRVRQGRATYRSGRVTDVRLATGRVTARVQGSRATPFLVEVEIPTLDAEDWDTVVELLAGRVRYSARLLAGHHPEGLLEEAAESGVRLLPTLQEIAVAAGHSGEDPFPVVGAALWEAVASRLDSSPFPLFRLRGRGRELLLRDVARRRRAGEGEGPQGIGVQEVPLLGWSSERQPLGNVAVPPVKHPTVGAARLRVLGDPNGWKGALSAAELFGPLVAGGADVAEQLLAGEPVRDDRGEESD